jgi:acetyl esterase
MPLFSPRKRPSPGRVPPLDPFVQTPPEMRLLAEASGALWTDGLPTVTHIETVETPVPAALSGRTGLPPAAGKRYHRCHAVLHGGGWLIGSVDTHDRLMRCLAIEMGLPVLGSTIDWRPNIPFPRR